MNNPTTASPVTRSAEVQRSIDWLNAMKNWDAKGRAQGAASILAYIAQLEAIAQVQGIPVEWTEVHGKKFLDGKQRIDYVRQCSSVMPSQPKPQQSDEGLREAVTPLVEAAYAMTFGTDWNKGNTAIMHGWRQKLIDAVPAARAALSQAPVPTTGALEWLPIDENHKPGTSIVLVSHGSGTWPAIWDNYAKGYIEYGTPDKTVIAATHYMPLPRLNLSALRQPPAADGKLEALRPMSEKPAQYPVLIKSAITGQFLQWNSDPWPVEHYWPDFVGWWDYIAAASALAQPASGGAHECYTGFDKGAPDAIKDRNGEVVLACCKKCGLGEVELDDNPICTGGRQSTSIRGGQ